MNMFFKLRYVPAALFLLMVAPMAHAASTPGLGQATSYGVLSGTYTNTTAGTTINGDVGFTTGPSVVPAGTHNNYGSGAPYSTAGTDQGIALTALNSQPCTFTFAPGAIDLSTDVTMPIPGTFTPGVYCSTGAMSISAALTLNGAGTYIFRPIGALNTTAGSIITLTGASACDVFWTPSQATTLGANSTFVGTDIDASGIAVGSTTTWSGRALAFGGTVSTVNATITVPAACSVSPVPAPPGGSVGLTGTINVVKVVVNDNGGTATVGSFPLFVNGIPVVSGMTNQFPAPASAYTVSETSNAQYTQTISGDCDVDGRVNLSPGQSRFCIITNNDIAVPVPVPVVPPVPPIIDVVKVPNPLALPAGPGLVEYSYIVRNIGTVPMTNITMVGDTCVPITLVSGDVNANSILEVSETWTYRCSTLLSETHTNTVVATGQANGLTATDIASATVVVGAPIVPPLIHVTKIPSPLTLPAGGGMVTYTETITNPGTVALRNVRLTDDKCSPVIFISGDTNGDAQLDTTETWTYTCRTNLSETTTNTAIATGEANGLGATSITARDLAIVTVVLAATVAVVPALPNTGFAPADATIALLVASAGMFVALTLLFALKRKRLS